MKYENLGKVVFGWKIFNRMNSVWIWIAMVVIVVAAAGCVEEPQPQESITLGNVPKLFGNDVIIVVGENASSIELDAAKAVAYDLGDISVTRTDAKITEEEKSGYNLILVGRPDSNKMLRDVYERTNATEVTSEYPGAGKGVLEVLRNPWNESKVMLLVEGSNEWGVRAGGIMLEDEQKLKDKIKVFVDWEEATGIKFPIDSAEEAIRYAKLDVDVKRFIKKWSAQGYNIYAKYSDTNDNWIVRLHAVDPVEEIFFIVEINSSGIFINKGGIL